MQKERLIVFALGFLSAICAANGSVPQSSGDGERTSPRGVLVAQQEPVKGEATRRPRHNPQHKARAPGTGKPTSTPGADAINTRLAPGS